MSFDRPALAAAVEAHGTVARVVLAEIAGSAPREAGAAMLVWATGQSGTIGGGALEFEAARRARTMLAGGPATAVARQPLGPALGQCCGGAATLVTEIWDAARLAGAGAGQDGLVARPVAADAPAEAPAAVHRRLEAAPRQAAAPAAAPPALVEGWLLEPETAPARPLWVWGAGHVGRAIVATLAPLPEFRLTWIDTGPERFPDTIPESVDQLVAENPPDLVAYAPALAEHLILTYSHELDLELCHRLLAHGFASAGLIGSATKRARFVSRLQTLGHPPQSIARIVCPIGEPALGKHPQAIAIGVAAALLRADAPALAAAPAAE